MNKASPVEMRKKLELVRKMQDAGILFDALAEIEKLCEQVA